MFKQCCIAFTTAALLVGCGGSNDIAEVNGRSISDEQFQAFLKHKRIPTQNEARVEKVLNQYLEREALADVVEEQSLLDGPLIEAELNEFRKEMLISRYFEEYLNKAVTDESVENYYNQNAAQYEVKKVHAAHILIRASKSMDENERKAKLTTAQEAYSKLKTGADFAELAKNYSEDKISGRKGGDLGWIKQGSISQVFSKRVFELKEGEFTEPFETPFGFHIAKQLESEKVVKKPFQAVKGDIRYLLRNKAKDAEMERLLKKTDIVKSKKS